MTECWKYERGVKYYETDRMGVVHHSNYLRILEDARMCWLDENIMRYRDMEKEGIIIPAVRAECEFRNFLHFDDLFEVYVHLLSYTGARLRFGYEIYNEETKVLCFVGRTEHYFAEDGDYKPIALKHRCPGLHGRFLEMIGK